MQPTVKEQKSVSGSFRFVAEGQASSGHYRTWGATAAEARANWHRDVTAHGLSRPAAAIAANMRTANLRAFIPTSLATVFDPSGNKFRLNGRDPIYDVRGCRSTLNVMLRGELVTFSVTSVAAGQTIMLRRPGQPDVKETFPHDGIVLDGAIRARPQMLAALRGRAIQLDVDFQPRQFGEGGATVASIAGVRLAKAGERGDCQLRLIG